MADEGYLSSAWESGDHSDFQTSSGHGRPQLRTFDSGESSSSPHVKSASPQPRSSFESAGRSSTSRWQDSSPPATTVERRDTLTTIHSDTTSLVEPSFDENVLRALCELDVCAEISLLLNADLSLQSSVERHCYLTE